LIFKGGAKQYGLKIQRKNSGGQCRHVLKIRGITLDYAAFKRLAHHDTTNSANQTAGVLSSHTPPPPSSDDVDDDNYPESSEEEEEDDEDNDCAGGVEEEDQEYCKKSYENFKNIVLQHAMLINNNDNNKDDDENMLGNRVKFAYKQLRPQRFGGIHTIHTSKNYRPIIINAVITNNFNVVPFGYNRNN
jgi:hypothetical protein